MAKIAGRGTDELGDFMAVLELGAVYLDERIRVLQECLDGGFHYVRFSGAGKEGAIARVLSFDGELSQEQRARLADIAERTPVTLTLKNGVAITTTLA